jgi:hypothetical protein
LKTPAEMTGFFVVDLNGKPFEGKVHLFFDDESLAEFYIK